VQVGVRQQRRDQPELGQQSGQPRQRGLGLFQGRAHHHGVVGRGYGDAADRVREFRRAGHVEEAEAAVPDEYIDECWLIGSIDRIVERWAAALDRRRMQPDRAHRQLAGSVSRG
jgi:hypothetical protein